jgi:hypothetical protein
LPVSTSFGVTIRSRRLAEVKAGKEVAEANDTIANTLDQVGRAMAEADGPNFANVIHLVIESWHGRHSNH